MVSKYLKLSKLISAVSLLLATGVASAAGPISEYYAGTGFGTGITVVQGSAVVRSWAAVNGCEWSLNVYNDVRTNPAGTACGAGAQYSLAGVYTGTNYAEEVSGYQNTDDSTTNGRSNFTASYSTGDIIQTDRDFNGASILFNAGARSLGITYDETNNSLWVISFSAALMRDYDLSGALLSSFAVDTSATGGLALDHVDQTLWYSDTNGDLQQYSKTGVHLGTGPNIGYVLGAEFDFAAAGRTPEPSGLALLGLGIAGLAVARRRRQ